MLTRNIKISQEEIIKFCQHWQVQELALFGSVLREDFKPDSDIDQGYFILDSAMYLFAFSRNYFDRLYSRMTNPRDSIKSQY